MILLQDEEDGEVEGEVREGVAVEDVVRGGCKESEISLNSVVGITSPKTMKLMGEALGQRVVVMIDLGATHNFVSLKAVEKSGIPLTPSNEFDVTLGMGEGVVGKGAL